MADRIDAERFPTLAQYLARLPAGLDAFPECKIRGSLVQSMLQSKPIADPHGALPDALVELIEHPPVATAWLPQVHGRAILRVIYDEHFRSEAAMARWAYDAQKRLFSGPLYRILFWGISPERLMKMAVNRYEHFHVGVSMTLLPGPRGGAVMLRFPERMFEPFDHKATLEGFRAALELAGAREVHSDVAQHGATEARLVIDWTT